LPILEAMACGTPVITSNATSLPEVAGDAALFFSPHNQAELEEVMKKVIENKILRNQLSHRGIARANSFSWEISARETLSVYEQVLAR